MQWNPEIYEGCNYITAAFFTSNIPHIIPPSEDRWNVKTSVYHWSIDQWFFTVPQGNSLDIYFLVHYEKERSSFCTARAKPLLVSVNPQTCPDSFVGSL